LEGTMTNNNGNNYLVNGDGSRNGGPLLTVSHVADSLNAHPHSVRSRADSGLLRCYRIGFRGGRGFRPEDVNDILDACGNGQG